MKDAKILLDKNFNLMVETLQNTIKFNTEKAAPAPNAPFGVNLANCLNYVLDVAKDMGLDTYNCDGYAGHADLVGNGTEVLGILGHLDVVPAKPEEWVHHPYQGVIADNKLWGRGTMDDKGPMIACLFAVKALADAGFKPSKTVRLIFGCDEESGMQCMHHYFGKMPFPGVAFSPDGDFPVINREKGIFQFAVKCDKLPDGVTINAGERANVVPSLCTVTSPIKLDVEGNCTEKVIEGGYLYTCTGKSAHGSTPNEGINATHPLLKALHKAFPDDITLDYVANQLCNTDGSGVGVKLSDKESGNLTMSLDILRTDEQGVLTAVADIRFPVTYRCKDIYDRIFLYTPAQFDILADHTTEPLHVPGESYLVTTLMDVYNTAMETNLQPLAIGGGTYSRCLPNCVAFGPLFPGEEQTIHMPNECIDLDSLRLQAHLYMEAIYRLAK